MKKITFTIEEMEICFSALAYMFADHEAREEYKSLLLDNKIEFPTNELDIISNIINTYIGEENMLQNYKVAEELHKINEYSEITSHSIYELSNIRFNAFIDKLKGNIDTLEDISLIDCYDNKESFMYHVNGNLRALINSEDKNSFANWNNKTWELITDEESRIIYGDFIKQCNFELRKKINILDKKSYLEINKRISSWNTDRNTKEALNNVKRDSSRIIDLKKYNANNNIICSHNGKIVNLNTGEIKKANRNDMILFTSKYNLMDKDDSIKFMNEKLSLYNDVLGPERLNFLLDLIAYKMLGKNLQLAIFIIGSGGTGKSLFKNIVKDLFENNVANIPYEYFTNGHRGNEDKSRDDLLVSLNNKLWGLSSEGDEDFIINQARFKTILSNSTETARPTKGTLVDINLKRLDLLIDTNKMPQFTNIDYAISRRLLFVNFVNRIPLDKVNPNYYTEEIATNFDYVFTYFVYRAIGIINQKISIPQCIKDDTAKNIEGIDSVTKFANKKIIPMPDCWVKFEEVEKEYTQFCEDEDMHNTIPINIEVVGTRCSIFTKALKEKLGYENIYSKRRSLSSNNKPHVIYGITFLDTSDINLFEVDEPKQINI